MTEETDVLQERVTQHIALIDEKNSVHEIQIYIDDGRVYSYKVTGIDKVREHTAAIAEHGYRSASDKEYVHYPVWRITKVKATPGITTKYPDKMHGT